MALNKCVNPRSPCAMAAVVSREARFAVPGGYQDAAGGELGDDFRGGHLRREREHGPSGAQPA